MSSTPRSRKFLPVLVAAIVLTAGVNLAAHGAPAAPAAPSKKPVLAGKVTKSGKVTTIQRTTNGPALRLRTKASSPPLTVTSDKKVKKLNADRVDGRNAASLETTTYAYPLPQGGTPSTDQRAEFPGLPQGTYLMTYAATLVASAAINNAWCFIHKPSADDLIGLSYAVANGSEATAHGTGLVTGSGETIQLRCSSQTAFAFDDTNARGMVTFTRTTPVTQDATPARRAPRSVESNGTTATER